MKFIKRIFKIYIIIVLLLILCYVKVNKISFIIIDGNSMYPTLKNNTIRLVQRLNIDIIKKNDIVVAKVDNRLVIKRVIAIEGDIVSIDNGYLKVNEDKIRRIEVFEDYKEKIRKGNVFLLGDNIYHSTDSREYGQIDKKNIIAKLIM